MTKMHHIEILALSSDREILLDELSRTKVFELKAAEIAGDGEQGFRKNGGGQRIDELKARVSRVQNCLSTMRELQNMLRERLQKNEKSKEKTEELSDTELKEPKKPVFFVRREVERSDIDAISEQEDEVLAKVGEIEAFSSVLNEMKQKTAKLRKSADELLPYLPIDIPFSDVADTKYVSLFLGTVSEETAAVIDSGDIPECFSLAEARVFRSEGAAAVFCMAEKSVAEDVLAFLSENGFQRCTLEYPLAAAAQREAFLAEIETLDRHYVEKLTEAADFTALKEKLELYSDYLYLKSEKADALENCGYTKRTLLIEGWTPVDRVSDVTNVILKASPSAMIESRKPKKGETPPTLVDSNKFARNYENITNMYAVPSYDEINPNTIMGVFFCLFFGLMLGDAGYGAVLALGTGVILLKFKLEKGMRYMMFVMFFGSLAAIFWGVLFGSYFSLGDPPKVFDAVNDPIPLLVLCIGLGLVHIMVGLGLKAANLIRNKEYLSVVFDIGSLYLLFIGAVLAIVGIFFEVGALSTAGLAVAIAGLVMMVLTQGRAKPTIGGKIAGGFASLYGLINYVSDLLSYSRLFCLAIVGAAFGMVTNILGETIIDIVKIPGLAHILGGAIAVLFHVFNLALSALSAYVHNTRLQFVEFFGKFYDGSGRLFKPLGVGTSYVVVRD